MQIISNDINCIYVQLQLQRTLYISDISFGQIFLNQIWVIATNAIDRHTLVNIASKSQYQSQVCPSIFV